MEIGLMKLHKGSTTRGLLLLNLVTLESWRRICLCRTFSDLSEFKLNRASTSPSVQIAKVDGFVTELLHRTVSASAIRMGSLSSRPQKSRAPRREQHSPQLIGAAKLTLLHSSAGAAGIDVSFLRPEPELRALRCSWLPRPCSGSSSRALRLSAVPVPVLGR